MQYVDGFVVAVPVANRERYRKLAAGAAAVYKEHDALGVVECRGDEVTEGELTSFPMAAKKKDDEVVVFAWIAWPSKAVRESGSAKVMADQRMQGDRSLLPFDAKRMICGGFSVMLNV